MKHRNPNYAQGPNQYLDGSSASVKASSMTEEPPQDYLHEVFTRLLVSLSDLTGLIEDESHRVDEFSNLGSVAEAVTSIQTFPDYEQYPVIVESVLVCGPPTTLFTLQLGKRLWNLTLPASGILPIAPVKFSLNRNDQRLLTSATPGNWSLEIMGHADIGYRFK